MNHGVAKHHQGKGGQEKGGLPARSAGKRYPNPTPFVRGIGTPSLDPGDLNCGVGSSPHLDVETVSPGCRVALVVLVGEHDPVREEGQSWPIPRKRDGIKHPPVLSVPDGVRSQVDLVARRIGGPAVDAGKGRGGRRQSGESSKPQGPKCKRSVAMPEHSVHCKMGGEESQTRGSNPVERRRSDFAVVRIEPLQHAILGGRSWPLPILAWSGGQDPSSGLPGRRG